MPHEGLSSRGAGVTLSHLTKTYDGKAVVDDVSLSIEPGEFVTLLGPSGSGKTTTLNMIAGFTDVTAGELAVGGEDVGRLPAHKRNIGVVFQHYALFPHMTVFENVAFPLKRRRLAKEEIRTRVAEALGAVRLEEFADRYPRQLSGGQQQRVAFARAIVFSPTVLLMDEPLGALDKKLREWLQLEIKRLHRELGTTFIYVTHDQEEALVLSDRVAVFNEGRVEQVGTAFELYERPETLFVAQFLGDSTCLPGTVAPDSGATVIEGAGFSVRARPNPSLAAGSPGVAVVRPERLRITDRPSDEPAGTNVLSATVEQVIYLGSARRLELSFGGGVSGSVREQAGQWSEAEEGARVTVACSPDDAVALAGAGE